MSQERWVEHATWAGIVVLIGVSGTGWVLLGFLFGVINALAFSERYDRERGAVPKETPGGGS